MSFRFFKRDLVNISVPIGKAFLCFLILNKTSGSKQVKDYSGIMKGDEPCDTRRMNKSHGAFNELESIWHEKLMNSWFKGAAISREQSHQEFSENFN